MKKALILVLVLATIVVTATAIKVVEHKVEAAYNSGFEAGLRHVVEDAELWIEVHNGIVEILIDIDGEIYVHGGGVDYVD